MSADADARVSSLWRAIRRSEAALAAALDESRSLTVQQPRTVPIAAQRASRAATVASQPVRDFKRLAANDGDGAASEAAT